MKKKSLIALALSACLAAVAQAQPELKGTPQDLEQYLTGVPRTMFLNGQGEIKEAADLADLTVVLKTEDKSFEEALKKNQAVKQKIEQALRDLGVPADRIRSAKFSSIPKTGWFDDRAKSYKVNSRLAIEVSAAAQFGEVAALVDRFPEARYEGASFRAADEPGRKRAALEKAVREVMAKKAVIEKEMGVELVPVGFAENTVLGGVQPLRPMLMRAKLAGASDGMTAEAQMAEPEGAEAGGFDELVFTCNVSAEFRLVSKGAKASTAPGK